MTTAFFQNPKTYRSRQGLLSSFYSIQNENRQITWLCLLRLPKIEQDIQHDSSTLPLIAALGTLICGRMLVVASKGKA
jgi:hypothetical protein